MDNKAEGSGSESRPREFITRCRELGSRKNVDLLGGHEGEFEILMM